MKKKQAHQWKHPGQQASDYSYSRDHDHDERTYASVGPRGYKRSDANIKEEASLLLYEHPDVDASEVMVKVEDQNVYLSGSVDSRHAKRMAGDLMFDISGVHDVFNGIIIKRELDFEEDKIIARGEDGIFTQEIVPR